MDSFESMRIQLSNNLKLLSIDEFIRKRKQNIEINPDTFRRLTPTVFQLITYFLFNKLNAEECGKRFIGCFPVLDRRQEGEFRQITNKWFQEITAKETNSHFPRVVPIYFQHFSPEAVVCHLYLEFTNYLLEKDIQRMSSGNQHLKAFNDMNSEELIEKTFGEYDRTKSQIKEETKESTEEMQYFVDNFCRLRDSLKSLEQKKCETADQIRQKHGLSDDSNVDEFLDNHSKGLQTLVDNLKTQLLDKNEVMAKSWGNYSIALNSQNDYSSDVSIDLNQWFAQNNCLSSASQEFVTRLEKYDSILQNGNELSFLKRFSFVLIAVSNNSLEKLSNVSTDYSNELQNYRKDLIETISQIKSMFDQLNGLSQKRREQLLTTPEIIEIRKWFAERIPDISKLRTKFEPKPRITKSEEPLPEVKSVDISEISPIIDDNSPIFANHPSMCDYSFQVMDISTCHYIPPNSYPIAMNDSHLFSPIENKTKSVFDKN